MTTKIRKWGNSYGIRVTKARVHELGLRDGSLIEVPNIKPVQKKYNLDELIASINPENLHPEIDWGPDVGNEILPEWKD